MSWQSTTLPTLGTEYTVGLLNEAQSLWYLLPCSLVNFHISQGADWGLKSLAITFFLEYNGGNNYRTGKFLKQETAAFLMRNLISMQIQVIKNLDRQNSKLIAQTGGFLPIEVKHRWDNWTSNRKILEPVIRR